MGEQVNKYCSVSIGPNIAFVIVSFARDQAISNFTDIKEGIRSAIRHSTTNLGLDHVRVTVIIPPGCAPTWQAYLKAGGALSQLKFEFYNVNIAFECATASNFFTFYEKCVVQAMCLRHGVTWIGSLSQRG